MSMRCSCPAKRRNLQGRKCLCVFLQVEVLNVFVLMCLQKGNQEQQQRGSIFPVLCSEAIQLGAP